MTPPCLLALRLEGTLEPGDVTGLCFHSHMDHDPLRGPMPGSCSVATSMFGLLMARTDDSPGT